MWLFLLKADAMRLGVRLPALITLRDVSFTEGVFNPESATAVVHSFDKPDKTADVVGSSRLCSQFATTRPGLRNLLALHVMTQNKTFAYLWN